DDYIRNTYNEPVYFQADPDYYVKHRDGNPFNLDHFFRNPWEYQSTFMPYTQVTDILIPCHFWDPKSPVFFKREDIIDPGFKISVIADVSCDVPGPIPSTLRSSSIAEPFYGYDPITGTEGEAFHPQNITVMAIDNLPGELPRDASEDFGNALINRIFPSLFGEDSEGIIERATIVKDGKLTERYSYLSDYAGLA
ncbi:MAG: alanine dehydrogenase, partial [Bacteroidia bacterium]|nr:alanine dehydrogenase [Bacteroidia bacterium]